MHEFNFCRIMKLNKWICAKKKANGLPFTRAMMKSTKANSIKFESNWSKESKEICTKSKSKLD